MENGVFKNIIRKKEIKVSVIIPVYNVEKYIERCLESVIHQTLKEIEIIIINDGSSDSTSKKIEKFLGDNRVIYIKTENKGQSAARNKGLQIAKGEYVGFVDSDDYIDLDFYEKLYKRIKETNSDIAAASIVRHHGTFEKWRVNYDLNKTTTDKNEMFKLVKYPNQSYVWNKIYKKEFLNSINFEFKEGVFYEDILALYYLLLNCKKLTTVTGTNYYYMVNEGISTVKGKQTKKKIQDCYNNQKETILGIIKNNIVIPKKEYFIKKKEIKFLNFPILKIKENLKTKKELFLLFNLIPIFYIKQTNLTLIKIFLKRLFSISKIDSHVLIYFLFLRLNVKYKSKVSVPIINESGINCTRRNVKLIASLTTFPDRINSVATTIKTIMNQTVKADEINLYLAVEQFPNKENGLPTELLKLKDFGLQIKFCNDIKSYKKIIPALKEYKNDIIITFDDDIYYEKDTIEALYNSYLKNPKVIQANRIWHIELKENKVMPKDKSFLYWNEESYKTPSFFNTIIGCGGVLYPPNSLSEMVLDEEKFKSIIPTQDDIWLWGMAVLAGSKIQLNKGYSSNLITVENTQNSGLCKLNNKKNKGVSGKDGFNIMVQNYPEILEILKKEE